MRLEEKYLDAHLEEVLRLVESPLSEKEFREHPLISHWSSVICHLPFGNGKW